MLPCGFVRSLIMKKVVLISCVSNKLSHQAKAKDLYISPLFKNNLEYAHRLKPDKIYILSAKHHLLNLDDMVEPYDLTLNKMHINELKVWSDIVIEQLGREIDLSNDEVVFLAGENYRKFLIPKIQNYKIPMKGLKIGEQLKFLTDALR